MDPISDIHNLHMTSEKNEPAYVPRKMPTKTFTKYSLDALCFLSNVHLQRFKRLSVAPITQSKFKKTTGTRNIYPKHPFVCWLIQKDSNPKPVQYRFCEGAISYKHHNEPNRWCLAKGPCQTFERHVIQLLACNCPTVAASNKQTLKAMNGLLKGLNKA